MNLGDLAQYDERQWRKITRQVFKGERDRKRAVRAAHRISLEELNDAGRKKLMKYPFRREARDVARRRGRTGATTWTYKKRERKITGFRKGINKRGSFSYQTRFGKDDITTRSFLNKSQYYNFVGHFFEGGFTPGRGTKYQGTRVPPVAWRYGPVRKPETDRRVRARMLKAMEVQISTGRTMTPTELRRAI